MDVFVLSQFVLILIPFVVVGYIAINYAQKIYAIQKINEKLIALADKNSWDDIKATLKKAPHSFILDGKNRLGFNLLHLAAIAGETEVIEEILERSPECKISINDQVDATGSSALHLAATIGKAKVVKTLLDNHADVNMKNAEGWTALHLACMKGRHQVKSVLLEYGADVSLKTNIGMTAFQLQESEKVIY